MEQEDNRRPLGETYGGQALIEGVLMRGRYRAAIAVRRPDGEILVREEPLSRLYRGVFTKIPFLRGIPLLWDSLGLGMRALFFSAEVAAQEEDPDFSMSGGMGLLTGALSLLLGVGLFMLLPSWVAGLVVAHNAWAFNLLEGMIRLALLIGYIAAVRLGVPRRFDASLPIMGRSTRQSMRMRMGLH